MNFLRVHAAARKRLRARKEILGLLKNVPLRGTKSSKKPLFVGKPFGIFGKALSFKVLLQDRMDGSPALKMNRSLISEINGSPTLKINGSPTLKMNGSINFQFENQIEASPTETQFNFSTADCKRIQSQEEIQSDCSDLTLTTPVGSEFSLSPLDHTTQKPQSQTPTEFDDSSGIDTEFVRDSFVTPIESPKLTIEMVMERKSLAARYAMNRLFPDEETSLHNFRDTCNLNF